MIGFAIYSRTSLRQESYGTARRSSTEEDAS